MAMRTATGGYLSQLSALLTCCGAACSVIGNQNGIIFYYRNTGIPSSPAFTQQTGGFNPFTGDLGYATTPSCADMDGDGDTDWCARPVL